MIRSIVWSIVLFAASTAHAKGPDADALAAKMLAHATFGADGAVVKARMIVVRGKDRSERAFEGASKAGGGGTKSLVRFSSPERIAGTALLVIETPGKATQQWVYLPAYKKTRRVAARDRDAAFLGSDFTYGDLERRWLRDGAHRVTGEETVDGAACWVLETTPKGAAYTKVVSIVRKDDGVPLRVTFYGDGDEVVKTTTTRKVEDVDGRPVVIETRTQRGDGYTDLVIDDLTFKNDLDDALFNPDSLSK